MEDITCPSFLADSDSDYCSKENSIEESGDIKPVEHFDGFAVNEEGFDILYLMFLYHK